MSIMNRGVYLLPNLMTGGNLFCGFMAVIQILHGSAPPGVFTTEASAHYQNALLFILGAFIFDILDGRLARLGGQESSFGREFDSLADLISFGIAPALLVYKFVLAELGEVGLLIAFLYLLCGAMRLARFNVLSSETKHGSRTNFTGFPIPAAAGLTASITLLLLRVYERIDEIGNWKFLLAFVMVAMSFLMFSHVQYPSFKALDWRVTFTPPKLLLAIIALIVVLRFYVYSLPVLFTLYLFYGFVRPHLSRAWRVSLAEDEPSSNSEDSTSQN